MKIAVAGGGVAGSFFALFAQEYDDVTVYEPSKYTYPCGEAIPVEATLNDTRLAVLLREFATTDIRKLKICVESLDNCKLHDFGMLMGYIIRKSDLINEVRKMINVKKERVSNLSELKKKYDVVVDARGPFSDSEEYDKLAVVRGFTDDKPIVELDDETIYMFFHPEVMGYYWIFPASNTGKWNIGFGATGYKQIHETFRTLSRKHGFTSIKNIQGKKIKVADPRKVAKANGIYRIGEAGGFIVPLTGEGIRPAIESAWHLKLTLDAEVQEFFNDVINDYVFHHRLYRLFKFIGPKRGAKLLLRLSGEDFMKLLSGASMGVKDALGLIFRALM